MTDDSDRHDHMVARAREALEIVLRHEHSGIPLDADAYPSALSVDIAAAVLRCFYDRNLRAGRALQDSGDEQGKPTVFRRRSSTNVDYPPLPVVTLESRARAIADAWEADHTAVDPETLDPQTRTAVRNELEARRQPERMSDAV